MTDKYQIVCEIGDYHIKLGEEIVCYDLRSPATATENWNNVVSRLNGLNAKKDVLKKEIERLKTQNKDLLYTNVKNMELLEKENKELKQVLGSILLEVKKDITNTSCTGEITVFINPNSFNLISDVLRKYGALKEWYE